eukprot:TRINITY_DN1106_c0_g2_i3.p1 TRINITY_DN1106_c0_g2~~TRINITY_DN1106_c0_g2_i3.p1  ORF type:complete len:532 (+),score=195.95 TRINITY_DN1106_c0_g2_i3:174-1769(+)
MQSNKPSAVDSDSIENYTLDKILGESDYTKRKTKIVCTIGPSCWAVDQLVKMLEAGMSVARLNFSHGDHKLHGETLERLREAFKLRKNLQCAVMLDTKGPEIRTGLLQGHQPIELKQGQDLEITTDYTFEGDNTKISCSYESLPKSVKVGSTILMADGTISCKVKEIREKSVVTEVLNNSKLGEKKNMNLPGVVVDLPTVTEKDEDDFVNFALKKGVDMIALSFARRAADIETVRDILGPKGSHIKIIAKIENQEGLDNFDEVLAAADGIMVARGDLGMEIPPQKVFVAQKWMIRKCNLVGKPVITATQMMESVIKNPRPTRAEASDVANAVLDGTDCVMLSGETANGDFPIQAVDTMAKICVEGENCFDYELNYRELSRKTKTTTQLLTSQESMAASAVRMSLDGGFRVIICFTETGDVARVCAKYRPKCPIVAVSIDDSVIKSLCLTRGVTCLRVPSFQGVDSLVEYAIRSSKEMAFCKTGDQVIVLHGTSEENPEKSNLLKILTVGQNGSPLAIQTKPLDIEVIKEQQ